MNQDIILHLFGWDKKFVLPFRDFIHENFDDGRHQFIIYGDVTEKDIPASRDTKVMPSILENFIGLTMAMKNAEKIILHGLFNNHLFYLLAVQPWLLKKCYWAIWGGDLYIRNAEVRGWRWKKNEIFRSIVIKRMGHLITYIAGDVERARQWYGAKGIYHECIMYQSNLVNPSITVEKNPSPEEAGLNILLGNSADPSNNHIEALERLLPYKDKDIKIYTPLSYGDQDYAQKVIDHGQEWFGEKFVAVTDFMPLESYLEFLKSLDFAIFNHQRQQAMGNTITLLGMGKTVLMRRDVSQWQFLNGLGIKLNDVQDLMLEPLERDEAQKNARIVHSYFSKATLIKQLSDIFEGNDGLSDKRNTTDHGIQGSR